MVNKVQLALSLLIEFFMVSVTVSLLTIQGTNCKTANLGQVADKTRGECISVDPLSITKEVSDILANPIIATNVKAKIILHKKL